MVKDLFSIFAPQIIIVLAIFCQTIMSLIKSPRLVFKFKNINIQTSNSISILALILSLISVFFLWGGDASFNTSIVISPFIKICSALIFISGIATLFMDANLLSENRQSCYKFHILLLTGILGAVCAICANDFLTLFVALEVLSFSLYFLISFSKGYLSKEASFKYLLTNSVSMAFFLFGVSYLLGLSSSVNFDDILSYLTSPTNIVLYSLSALFIFVGLVMKLAIFPFANWIIDVYAGTETSVLAFLSSIPKIVVICVLFRLLSGVLSYSLELTVCILILATFTAFWANIYAVKENNIKKILACSSAANASYMLIVLPLVSAVGDAAVLFYLISYTIMNLGVWAYLNMLEAKLKSWALDDFKRVNNLFKSGLYIVLLFGLAGLPVSIGFVAKVYLLYALISAGLLYLPVLLILFVLFVISLYYYIRVARAILNGVIDTNSRGSSLVLYLTTGLTLILGLLPWRIISECVKIFS